jgi:hypothetical protein
MTAKSFDYVFQAFPAVDKTPSFINTAGVEFFKPEWNHRNRFAPTIGA